ncbi:putative methyltransferase C1347,09 [Schizosaccharomyces pombe 972h-] [Rhizoctonia solani]|uniref:Putative methyltransferase C1347,09 [Schizosaccharomyces pombe 972h-] n=1 Tax=Rhizoctonia solani TaxID=456999 RepID=A0A0K6FNI6_9AGAM|nr:putative methyltransferase C1347,09 [Schizosaccharomyces pombe 972h-] [Rhizoctonia solani]
MSHATIDSHTHAENGAGHHARPTPEGFKEANRQWFDSQAHNYEGGYEAQPAAQDMAKKATAAFLEAFPFDKSQTIVMDFACGTGMISQQLAPHSKKIIGVDISPKSVDFYNERVTKQGVSQAEMKAICADLAERGKAESDIFDGIEFDVIVCSGAYHHFDSINDMTKILTSYLKPGTGMLVIVDIIKSPEAAYLLSKHNHIVVNTNGFDEESIRSAFVDAGDLQNFSFKPAFQMTWHEKDVELFVAKGIRPGL